MYRRIEQQYTKGMSRQTTASLTGMPIVFHDPSAVHRPADVVLLPGPIMENVGSKGEPNTGIAPPTQSLLITPESLSRSPAGLTTQPNQRSG
jgi:hypothetical protein